MINPLDLRLNNWILVNGKPVQVTMLSIGITFYCINGVNLDKKTGLTMDDKKEDRFSGIELTYDILTSAFFEDNYKSHLSHKMQHKQHTSIVYSLTKNTISYFGQGISELFFLHQLQNTYHTLIAQELSYHPSTISETTE